MQKVFKLKEWPSHYIIAKCLLVVGITSRSWIWNEMAKHTCKSMADSFQCMAKTTTIL